MRQQNPLNCFSIWPLLPATNNTATDMHTQSLLFSHRNMFQTHATKCNIICLLVLTAWRLLYKIWVKIQDITVHCLFLLWHQFMPKSCSILCLFKSITDMLWIHMNKKNMHASGIRADLCDAQQKYLFYAHKVTCMWYDLKQSCWL